MNNPGINKARNVLQQYWGYENFRPGQEKAITSVLNGQDTLVLFPTGGGKSLCYQVPALLFDGLTIVISPLISLMQDQAEQLKAVGIQSAYINSTLRSREIEQRLVNARNGMYKLLYVSPERLETDIWQAELPNLNISFVAVDEAHCISQWGHEFRPAYRNIKHGFADAANKPAWAALTATATPEVRQDILDSLGFQNPAIVTGSFKRENLVWWVHQTEKKHSEMQRSVQKAAKLGSGIIYSPTRKNCNMWADTFSGLGIACLPYHAGLGNDIRSDVQQKWVSGEIPMVAATNAFGMGIDKPDCRFVIHETIPFSLEAYYQEAGRAGRDGNPAYPLLMYKPGDIITLQSRIEKAYPTPDKLQAVYNALCDELNLATGSSQENGHIVAFHKVAKRAGLPASVVKISIELFRRLELLDMNELYEPRVGVQFLVSQDYLMRIIDEAPERKGEFLDNLMRQFGPKAFHATSFVSESRLLEKLQVTSSQLEKALDVFASHDQILTFEYDKENTLIFLKDPRMQKLQIDQRKAYFYKEILLDKLRYMQRYAETSECREVFLRNYFGETHCKPCGKCDNCTREKTAKPVTIEKEDVSMVMSILASTEKTDIQEVQKKSGWGGRKTKHVLTYMCREELLVVNDVDGDEIYKLPADD